MQKNPLKIKLWCKTNTIKATWQPKNGQSGLAIFSDANRLPNRRCGTLKTGKWACGFDDSNIYMTNDFVIQNKSLRNKLVMQLDSIKFYVANYYYVTS
jgi:hypothetical protein